MKMYVPWQERIVQGGSASTSTVYGGRVPPGKCILLRTISCTIYTTTIHDYETAKWIGIGIEVNNTKHYIKIRDTASGSWNIWLQTDVTMKEGDRIFATVEGTAATTKYELVGNGQTCDAEELNGLAANTQDSD